MRSATKAGFSLLQLSVILTVGALMLAATLPAGGDLDKTRITLERMRMIEEATKGFMTQNKRRPYPSDITAATTAAGYGVELAIPYDYSTAQTGIFTQTSAATTFTRTSGSTGLTSGTTSGITKNRLISGTGISNYGWVEGVTSTTALTMSEAATASGSTGLYFRNPLVAGGVPTKTLGLPDEYGIDGYGRRIVYMVDSRVTVGSTYSAVSAAANNGSGAIRLTVASTTGLNTGDRVTVRSVAGTTEANGIWTATVVSSTTLDLQGSSYTNAYTSGGTVMFGADGCATIQNRNERGALMLSSTSNFTTGTYDQTMWALLSYGKDGQGSTPIQGGSTRLTTGNTDADTLANAFYNGSQVSTYAPSGLVNKASTRTFDDIVWVNQTTKNKCYSSQSYGRDFRIDGGGSANANASAAFGDVNGDGYQDMIFGIPQQNLVRVIFGKKSGWPTPSTAYTSSAVDGTSGTTIARGSGTMTVFGTRVAVGDVNGDGYDDIIAGGTPVSATTDPAYAVIFGGTTWPTTYTIGTSTSPATAILLSGLNVTTTSHISVGDVNGDGMADIALPIGGTAGGTYANFDGINDYVSIPSNATLSRTSGDLTLSAWFKPNGTYTSGQTIIGNGTGASNYGLTLGYTPNKIQFWNWGGGPTATSTTSVSSNSWYHVVAVRTGSTGAWNNKLYVNGVLEANASTASNPNAGSPVPTAIGRFGSFSAYYFKGLISDVRVYSSALTADNVTYLYTSGASGTDPTTTNLIGYWKLDEGTGTTIADSSASGFTGTATNITAATFWQSGAVAKFGVVYGKASGWANMTLGTTTLLGNATDGFRFNVATANTTNGDISFGGDTNAESFRLSAICDVNGDGYKDVMIPGAGSTYIQRIYVMLGNTRANWASVASSGLIDPSSAASMLKFNTSAAAGSPNYDINGIACEDINSDGKDDILFYLKNNSSAQEYIYTWFGRSSPATADIDATYDIRFDLTANAPTGKDAATIPQLTFADVNNDGKKDIILSRTTDDPYFSLSGSTFTLTTNGSGTVRTDAGTAYMMMQPSSWSSSTYNWFDWDFDGLSDGDADGKTGLKIAGGVANDAIAVEDSADMNKDSKNDLLLRSGVSPTGGYFIFGKNTWPTSGAYDTNCTRDTSGAHCAGQSRP